MPIVLKSVRRAIRWFPLIALCWLAIAAAAQPLTLEPGEPQTVQLDGEGPALLTYAADPGDVVTITARTLEETVEFEYERDLVLEVLTPDGERLAYNDNHRTERDDLLPSDAALTRLVLPTDGTYTIRVNTYGGTFPGAASVLLETDDRFQLDVRDDDDSGARTVEGVLPRGVTFVYPLELTAGDTWTFTARDIDARLDPRLTLLGPDGDEIAANDDHGTADLSLDVLDAQITALAIETSGTYTLELRDFLGRGGAFALTLTPR